MKICCSHTILSAHAERKIEVTFLVSRSHSTEGVGEESTWCLRWYVGGQILTVARGSRGWATAGDSPADRVLASAEACLGVECYGGDELSTSLPEGIVRESVLVVGGQGRNGKWAHRSRGRIQEQALAEGPMREAPTCDRPMPQFQRRGLSLLTSPASTILIWDPPSYPAALLFFPWAALIVRRLHGEEVSRNWTIFAPQTSHPLFWEGKSTSYGAKNTVPFFLSKTRSKVTF